LLADLHAVCTRLARLDPDLARILSAWPRLRDRDRKEILRIIEAVRPQACEGRLPDARE
jgi:hypothetical protein